MMTNGKKESCVFGHLFRKNYNGNMKGKYDSN